jgi:23S rRNA (cytosine1962-C5)-methyltransferase
VFAGSIDRVEGEPQPGDEVAVCSFEGRFVARGLFNPHSAIRVRLYRWEDSPLDREFWNGKIASAIRLRTRILGLGAPGTGCRLVFSEADGLSGLTVDRYDRWLVVQITSLALHVRQEELLDALWEQTRPSGIVLRGDSRIAEAEGLPPGDRSIRGEVPEGPISIVEHGLRFLVDLTAGQKTGFYLDQRDNRAAAARYARGRRVLDLFCHTGSFSLTALKVGGAQDALGIDSSARAIAMARDTARLNELPTARFESADVFATLDHLRAAGERFGLVVVDPPRFARRARSVEEALKGYLRLNRSVVDLVEPDGVLVTCSCSGLVDRALFGQVLGQVAELAGRPIQFLEQRGPAPDHPVSASCLESDYLKCLICRIG